MLSLTKIHKITALFNKFTLLTLIFTLGYSGIISAGLTDRLSSAWRKSMETRDGQVQAAVAVTAFTLVAGYSAYRLGSAVSTWYTNYSERHRTALIQYLDSAAVTAVKAADHASLGNLVSRGANVMAIQPDGTTVLQAAVLSGDIKIITKILNEMARVQMGPASDSAAEASAVVRNIADFSDGDTDNAVVTPMVSRDLKDIINLYDGTGKTALIYAVAAGNLDLVIFLLAQGARANLAGQDGLTPLMCLAQVAHKHSYAVELAEQLISNISVTSADTTVEIVQAAKTAYVDQINNKFLGLTALSLALFNYEQLNTQFHCEARQILVTDFIKLLLKYGVDYSGTYKGTLISLHPVIRAALHTDTSAMAHVASGAVESKDHVASVSSEDHIAVGGSGGGGSSGKDSSTSVVNNISAAVAIDHVSAVAENTLSTTDQNLALYFKLINETNLNSEAYASNWREVDRLLSTCLVDVGVRDESGQTGLMIAVKRVNLAMVNCLLRHGANVRAKFNYNNLFHDDSEALTPFMFLAFADTGDEFYREVAALEMISLLNQHELALIKHDMEHGIVPRAMSAPESPDDARFKELIKRYHSAETALKFIRRHTGTKHVIQLFLPETLSLSLRDIFSK